MLISNNSLLEVECQKIIDEKVQIIAIDTEFINESKGPPKLCIIQVAYEGHAFCVDMLAKDIDLSLLTEIFVKREILKAFHDCKQDILALHPIFRVIPYPILDTQVGAMMCRYYEEHVGYAKVVEDFLSIKIDKSLKRSNWKKRPLSKGQMAYIKADVTYLYKLVRKILDELQVLGRISWIVEESDNLLMEFTEKLKLYNNLYNLRQIIAEEKSVLPKEIATDVDIYKLSRLSLHKVEQIKNLLLNTSFNFSDLSHLFPTLRPTMQNNPLKIEGGQLIAMFLYTWLIALALKYNISPKIIASINDINELLYKQDNKKNPILNGWRYKHFGNFLEKFLQASNQTKLINSLLDQIRI